LKRVWDFRFVERVKPQEFSQEKDETKPDGSEDHAQVMAGKAWPSETANSTPDRLPRSLGTRNSILPIRVTRLRLRRITSVQCAALASSTSPAARNRGSVWWTRARWSSWTPFSYPPARDINWQSFLDQIELDLW